MTTDATTTGHHPTEARQRGATSRFGSATGLVLVGALCGLAWAAGLRGFMSELAGTGSVVSWYGTFGEVLAPGVATGMLLGWAEHLRRAGGGRGWRWLACAPLTYLVVLARPGQLEELLTSGLGGAAVAVPLLAMAGGYALSGRGPAWGRAVCGLLALSQIPSWIATSTLFFGLGAAIDTPRGAWIALYYWSFVAVLSVACAIPHLPVATSRFPDAPPDR
jgi:hypothetical protein